MDDDGHVGGPSDSVIDDDDGDAGGPSDSVMDGDDDDDGELVGTVTT